MKKEFVTKHLLGDRDIAQFIGQQLRAGVVASCSIAIIGGILYLAQHGNTAMPDYRVFKGEPTGLTSISAIFKGLLALDAGAIIQLGVAVLVATPIIRIALSLLAFAIEKDWMYVVITFIVLCIISTSIFGGIKL